MLSRRRLILSALPTAAFAVVRPASAGYNIWNNEYTFTREEIQAVVASRFPVNARVGQLMSIRLANPRVSMDTARSRLRTRLDARLENPLLLSAPIDGSFAVTNGLRYDTARRAVLLDQPDAEAVSVPGLPPQYASQLQAAASMLANEVLRDYAVHTFKPEELVVGGRRIEPQSITVEPEGLKVALAFK